jgi:hypothetical protein
VCDNKEIIETNIRNVKISSPDVSSLVFLLTFLLNPVKYRGWDPDKAVEDYYGRIRDREKSYETVEETTWPFIRIINVCPMYTNPVSFVGLPAWLKLGRRENHGQCMSQCTSISVDLINSRTEHPWLFTGG